MRLISRFFRSPGQALAPEPPTELIERGLAAASTAIESAGRGSRGRSAATVAVGVTLVVATAAYVWWKRRDQSSVAVLEAMPVPATPVPPVASVPPIVMHEATVTDAPTVPAVASLPPTDVAPSAAPPVVERPSAVEAVEPVERTVRETTKESAASEQVSGRSLDLGECADGSRRATPQPAVASTQPASSLPPTTTGRFAMPGVRSVVLPGGGSSLP